MCVTILRQKSLFKKINQEYSIIQIKISRI